MDLFSWQTGIGRGWPLTDAEEKLFRAHLPPKPYYLEITRPDITAVMLALREGAYPEDLHNFLPGLSLPHISAAYYLVLEKLETSLDSWYHICRSPTHTNVVKHIDVASRVLPIPTSRIAFVVTNPDLITLPTLVPQLAKNVECVTRNTMDLERRVADAGKHSPQSAINMSVEIHHPFNTCAWSDPFFLPKRVGALCPTRLARLLGETK